MITFYNSLELNKYKQRCVFGELKVEKIANGRMVFEETKLMPSTYIRGARTWWTRRTQGVFDSNGKHIKVLSDMRADRHIWWPTTELIEAMGTYEFEEIKIAYFGGTIYDHFGHFLLDSLSRLYPLLDEIKTNSLPIIFHFAKDSIEEKSLLEGYVGHFFNLLGVSHTRLIFITEPMKCGTLITHSPTFSDTNFSVQKIHELFPKLSIKDKSKKRGFVSKSKLTSGTGTTNQAFEIDEIFSSFGFDIIHPELLPLEQQIDVMQSYDVLVGFPSSFFHLKLFCSDGAKLCIMFPELSEFLHINFLNIDVSCSYFDLFVPLTASEQISPAGFAKGFAIELSEIMELAKITS